MCLLIASKTKVKNLDWLSNGFENNSHGAGFVYTHNKRLVLKKGFFSIESFLKAYEEMPDDAPCIIHFRLATGGKMNEENCHPFYVSNNMAFAHNGIFYNINPCDNYSDTWYFNEQIVKPLFGKNGNAVYTRAAEIVLSDFIGAGNKLAFLNHKGDIQIINHEAGTMEGDAWFSNCSYLHGRSKNFSKKGNKLVKIYSSVNHYPNKLDGYNPGSHPKPCDWLRPIIKSVREEEAKEMLAKTRAEEELQGDSFIDINEAFRLHAIAD